MKKEQKMITVKVEDDDEYKEELTSQMMDDFGDNTDTQLQRNIAVGFAEAFRELGHRNFDIIVKN